MIFLCAYRYQILLASIFFPSPGPLPHRIRLRTNQQPSLTSILLVLTCEPVTPGNLKGDRTETVTSRKWFRNEKKIDLYLIKNVPYNGIFSVWYLFRDVQNHLDRCSVKGPSFLRTLRTNILGSIFKRLRSQVSIWRKLKSQKWSP